MHKAEIRDQFRESVQKQDENLDLERVIFLIAAEAHREIDIDSCRNQLDQIASQISFDPDQPLDVGVARIIEHLHNELGFGGNINNYYDPDNSYLNRVLETRLGIPISLGLIHISVGARLGMPVGGVNFPGHFLVRYGDDKEVLVDPFQGSVLSRHDCEVLYKQVAGPDEELDPRFFELAHNKEIVNRVLDNLKQIFWRRKNWDESLSCVERQLLVTPDSPGLLIDLGDVYQNQGHIPLARETYVKALGLANESELKDVAGKRLLALEESGGAVH